MIATNLAELRELTLLLETLTHLNYTPCLNCGDKLVPGYTSKTIEDFFKRERPDFWFCDHCQLEYKETSGNLKRSQRKE